MNKSTQKNIKYRAIALLNREEMEFLEKLGMEALFSTGHRLTKVEIIAALIDAGIQLKITGQDVINKEALIEKIVKTQRKGMEHRL